MQDLNDLYYFVSVVIMAVLPLLVGRSACRNRS
jgi:hypothetical protein